MTPEQAEVSRILSEIEKNRAERDKYRREAEEISKRLNQKWYQKAQNLALVYLVVIAVFAGGYIGLGGEMPSMQGSSGSIRDGHKNSIASINTERITKPADNRHTHKLHTDEKIEDSPDRADNSSTMVGAVDAEKHELAPVTVAKSELPGVNTTTTNGENPSANNMSQSNGSNGKQAVIEKKVANVVQNSTARHTGSVPPVAGNSSSDATTAKPPLAAVSSANLQQQTLGKFIDQRATENNATQAHPVSGENSTNKNIIAMPLDAAKQANGQDGKGQGNRQLENGTEQASSIANADKPTPENPVLSGKTLPGPELPDKVAALEQQNDELQRQLDAQLAQIKAEREALERLKKDKLALEKRNASLLSEKNVVATLNKRLEETNRGLKKKSVALQSETKQLKKDNNNLAEKYRVLAQAKKEKRAGGSTTLSDLNLFEQNKNSALLKNATSSRQPGTSKSDSYLTLNGAHVKVQYPQHRYIDDVYADLAAKFSKIGVKTSKQVTKANQFLFDASGKERELSRKEISFTLSYSSDVKEQAKAQLIQQYLVENGFPTTVWKTDIFPSLLLNTIVE